VTAGRGAAAWFTPRMRMLLARIVVVIGIVIALLALVTARWGLLFVAVIVVGLGAAMSPARRRS
jgi:type IV secretory pathway VirB2 component (pilin)